MPIGSILVASIVPSLSPKPVLFAELSCSTGSCRRYGKLGFEFSIVTKAITWKIPTKGDTHLNIIVLLWVAIRRGRCRVRHSSGDIYALHQVRNIRDADDNRILSRDHS